MPSSVPFPAIPFVYKTDVLPSSATPVLKGSVIILNGCPNAFKINLYVLPLYKVIVGLFVRLATAPSVLKLYAPVTVVTFISLTELVPTVLIVIGFGPSGNQ